MSFRQVALACVVVVSGMFSAASATSGEGEPIDLAPKFVVGDEKTFVASVQYGRTDERILTTAAEGDASGGKKATQDSSLEVTVVRRITEVTDAGAIAELVYKRIKIVSRDPLTALEFDSDTPADQDANNPLAAAIRPLIGTAVTLTVMPDGQFSSIRRPESIEHSQAAGAMVAQIMGDAPVRELFGPVFAVKLPPPSSKVGESWTRIDSIPVASKASITVKRTDTLESASQGQAIVNIKGVITMKVDPTNTEELPVLKDSKMEGTLIWDLDTGTVRAYDVTQMIRVEGTQDGVTTSTRNESQTSVRRLD